MEATQEKRTGDHSNTRSQPAGWPEDLGYRSWKMWAVRVLVALIALGLIFALGMWYGFDKGTSAAPAHDHAAAEAAAPGEEILYWSCSMHPQIKKPGPDKCPICFMDLIPVLAGAEDDDPNAPRLGLSARARELARVLTTPVERREVAVDVRMVGKVMTDETLITQISSYVPGRLDRLFVDYTGIFVRKGDHLAEIYSPELLVAQREYLLALEARERAAQGGLNLSPTERTGADAMLQSARRKLELWGIPEDQIEALRRDRQPSDHMRIDAPQEGWVVERQGYEGMYVDTGTKLFTLADLRTVWVMLDAYELDIGYVRLGQEVQFETEAFPGQAFQGRVAYVDPVLDPKTRTVQVRLNVPNPDMKLRPEMFVRARLKAQLGKDGMVVEESLAGKWLCPMHPEVVKDGPGECDKCGMDLVKAETLGYVSTGARAAKLLAVPQTAVLLTGKRAVVYVEQTKDDGTPVYEGRVVQLGPRTGDYYVIEDGLEEGERVVTRGALMIDSALQIMAKPSMMQPPADAVAEDELAELPSYYVAGAGYHQQAKPVIEAYLAFASALANDDAETAGRAMADLRKSLPSAKADGLQGDAADAFQARMKALQEVLPEAADGSIDYLRGKLPDLTRQLEMYLQVFGHELDAPVVKVFCSMAFDNQGAAWFQADEKVRNAYFGDKMLRCGEVKKHYEPGGGDAEASEQAASAPTQSRAVSGAMYHQHVAPVVDAYLKLVAELARSDAAKASEAAASMRSALAKTEPHGLSDEDAKLFQDQMHKLSAALPKDGKPALSALRESLPAITAALQKYLSTFGHSRPEPLVRHFCSMAFDDRGAGWLQADRNTLNPYFGDEMRRCGVIELTIERDGSVKKE
ncbi:MAG: hypothetical protein AMXMBFR13_08940 [Phycisphaerae bacterium]